MNIKELIQVIEEQNAIRFNGKINLLTQDNGQLLGSLFIIDGEIVHLFYKRKQSQRALENLIYDLVKTTEKIRVIEEPEVVAEKVQTMKLKSSEFRSFIADFMDHLTKLEQLRPPQDVFLLPSAGAIHASSNLTPLEFDLVNALVVDSQVQSVYQSGLMPYEVDRGLYSLRKKGLLKVYK